MERRIKFSNEENAFKLKKLQKINHSQKKSVWYRWILFWVCISVYALCIPFFPYHFLLSFPLLLHLCPSLISFSLRTDICFSVAVTTQALIRLFWFLFFSFCLQICLFSRNCAYIKKFFFSSSSRCCLSSSLFHIKFFCY